MEMGSKTVVDWGRPMEMRTHGASPGRVAGRRRQPSAPPRPFEAAAAPPPAPPLLFAAVALPRPAAAVAGPPLPAVFALPPPVAPVLPLAVRLARVPHLARGLPVWDPPRPARWPLLRTLEQRPWPPLGALPRRLQVPWASPEPDALGQWQQPPHCPAADVLVAPLGPGRDPRTPRPAERGVQPGAVWIPRVPQAQQRPSRVPQRPSRPQNRQWLRAWRRHLPTAQ